MNIFKRAKNKLKRIFGNFLRKHFQSLTVKRPYIINSGPRQRLKGKIAVITGGAGAIGRACGFRLAAEGATVYICGRSADKAEAAAAEIREANLSAKPKIMDVRSAESIKAAFGQIAEENGGKIDILINSAGGSARADSKEFINQDLEVIDNILETNLRGAMLCAKYAAAHMLQGGGNIINITSVIGIQGKAGFSEYAAAKAGSIVFAKSLAQELGKYNITVNCVSPGIVQRGEIKPEDLQRISATNFLQSYGTPEDIANAAAFLCSGEASFITGQNIVVDGGRSLGLKEK